MRNNLTNQILNNVLKLNKTNKLKHHYKADVWENGFSYRISFSEGIVRSNNKEIKQT